MNFKSALTMYSSVDPIQWEENVQLMCFTSFDKSKQSIEEQWNQGECLLSPLLSIFVLFPPVSIPPSLLLLLKFEFGRNWIWVVNVVCTEKPKNSPLVYDCEILWSSQAELEFAISNSILREILLKSQIFRSQSYFQRQNFQLVKSVIAFIICSVMQKVLTDQCMIRWRNLLMLTSYWLRLNFSRFLWDRMVPLDLPNATSCFFWDWMRCFIVMLVSLCVQ